MTEAEAIKNLEDIKRLYTWSTGADDALDMAIEALKNQKGARGRVTNIEKLRAMTDEEIAEAVCEMTKVCKNCVGYSLCVWGDGKANGMIKWLKMHDEAINMAIEALQNIPTQMSETSGSDTNVGSNDLISRQAAIDEWKNDFKEYVNALDIPRDDYNGIMAYIDELPSTQPTLYGYNIEHLELIARVLQKENLPPEKIVEVLTDIGRIVAIVKDEFEEALRKEVEQCTI